MSQSVHQVRALERALDLLGVFSLSEPELSLSDLALRVDLAKSTAFRLLSTLEERGYVERAQSSDRYRLGIQTFELGSVFIQSTTVEREVRPFLERLALECAQTANLAVLNKDQIIHLAVMPPDRPIRFASAIGERQPASCSGLGKALLSGLTPTELPNLYAVCDLPRRTANSITSLDVLQEELASVREKGFSFDDEEEYIGLLCVAAPIRDATNKVIAAASVSGPAAEFSDENISVYVGHVSSVAEKISARMGNSLWSAEVDAATNVAGTYV